MTPFPSARTKMFRISLIKALFYDILCSMQNFQPVASFSPIPYSNPRMYLSSQILDLLPGKKIARTLRGSRRGRMKHDFMAPLDGEGYGS
jgi:hypothetical protein